MYAHFLRHSYLSTNNFARGKFLFQFAAQTCSRSFSFIFSNFEFFLLQIFLHLTSSPFFFSSLFFPLQQSLYIDFFKSLLQFAAQFFYLFQISQHSSTLFTNMPYFPLSVSLREKLPSGILCSIQLGWLKKTKKKQPISDIFKSKFPPGAPVFFALLKLFIMSLICVPPSHTKSLFLPI